MDVFKIWEMIFIVLSLLILFFVVAFAVLTIGAFLKGMLRSIKNKGDKNE